MLRLVTHSERCKSCEYCIRDCPVKAITLSGRLNKEGYEYTVVDNTLCIKCGTCYTVCPDLVFELLDEA